MPPRTRPAVQHQALDAFQRAALVRAETDIGCAASDAHVGSLGHARYRVYGCDAYAIYACMQRGRRAECTIEQRGAIVEASWSDAAVGELGLAMRDEVLACLPAGVPALSVELGLSPRGQVRRVGELSLDPAELECVDARVSSQRLEGSVPNPRFVTVTLVRPVESAAPIASEVATTRPAAGRAARDAIDEVAPSILTCAQAPEIALRLTWTAEGQLDAEVLGTALSPPEVACVRSAVGRLTIPAPGRAGAFVYSVQR